MFQFLMGFATCLLLVFLYSVIAINKEEEGGEK